jgi:GTP-binding nuclear protein Ran
MFSVHDKASYKEADTKYRRSIERVAEKVPMCLVGNKVDQKDRTVKMKEINLHRKIGIEYFEVSVKSGYNLKRPFLSIIRKMFKYVTD